MVKKILKWIGIAFLVLVGIGIINAIANPEEFNKSVQEEKQKKYSIVADPTLLVEGEEPFTIKYIVGTLKNNTNKKTNYVQISFSLYDKDGNVIGTALDNVNYIEPDGTWKFKAMILSDEFETFKFEDITGF